MPTSFRSFQFCFLRYFREIAIVQRFTVTRAGLIPIVFLSKRVHVFVEFRLMNRDVTSLVGR
ncbi:hypothetical protein BZM27_37010 [Paraburkholderia steynii]|uniref:Uncharacterized protein n=1 Tax=Paraburkholderia steynii TaxID=1245441 RepID=A0A4R0X4B8_9BURK|nr:hypothetical protein BZM27_37010 [Paraburkholderia steynii]